MLNSSQVYRVSWTDADRGVTVYDTLSEKVAREIHSEVMGHQLTGNKIYNVKVSIVKF